MIGLLIGFLTFVNMSLQANRIDFFNIHYWHDRKVHKDFQERIAARNRLTTNLVVRSVRAEYMKLEKRQ